MLKAVLDTNILVSGLLSGYGNPAAIVNAFREGHLSLIYNDEMLDEYLDVLSRGRLGLDRKDIDDLLEAILRQGSLANAPASDIPLPDEDDRIFYDTAKAAKAYLVTGNIKHFPNEPLIKTPAEFVKLLGC